MDAITLEHANLNVTNVEQSLRFYGTLLPGWTIRWRGTTSTGAPWVHFGPPGEGQPGYLSIYEDADAKPAPADGVLRVQHLGFAHPDVDALVREAVMRGIEPTDRIEEGRHRRAYFEDPDGHEVEIVQLLG